MAMFATHLLVDSQSQKQFLVDEGIFTADRGTVIGNGSICGVDSRRFCPDASARAAIRHELGIAADDTVFLFLGRLNREKGVKELAKAFSIIAAERTDVRLVFVGAEEDVAYAEIINICDSQADKLARVLFTPEPHKFMAAADIFCLPSYREGFGQVIIEAAACGIPAISTRIYGVTDAVEDNITGLLVPPESVESLVEAMRKLAGNPELCKRMGEAARKRVIELFDHEKVTRGLIAFYNQLLHD
jgi:glycosyltransferase involved in cell wall biosynthesis